MKSWVLILVALLFSTSVVAQSTVTFRYEGVQDSDVRAIERSSPQIFRQPSLYHLDQLVRALMATQNYSSVEIYEDSGALVVVGSPLKVLAEVRIRGNTTLSSTEILERSGLVTGQKMGQDQIIQARQNIETLMTEKGFFGFSLEKTGRTYYEGPSLSTGPGSDPAI